MAMKRWNVVASYKTSGDKTRYSRVGAMFENTSRKTGETYYAIKLDFPIGVTDLVAFTPQAKNGDTGEGEF